jgi:hypothetical protein
MRVPLKSCRRHPWVAPLDELLVAGGVDDLQAFGADQRSFRVLRRLPQRAHWVGEIYCRTTRNLSAGR